MIPRTLVLVVLMTSSMLAAAAPAPATMRLDYYHTGNSKQEVFSLDRIVIEPLPWPGNAAHPLDETGFGNYFFEVIDQATSRTLYSRGFSSVYGEWVTTDEAQHASRTFSESLRFPAPTRSVRIVLKERKDGVFQEVWTTSIDPKDKFIDNARPSAPGALLEIQNSGDPANKVDLLILGDGYTAAERPKFEKDARRFAELLFATSPFREHRRDFNVWGLCPPALESGISRPSTGVHRRNPLGATYDTFDSERYVLTTENRAWRDVASFAPYEFVEILVNNETYGGGGIFNLYSTVAADSAWAAYLEVHEFGHQFAGLADEYYTSDVSFTNPPQRHEPWEPNVTALLDPDQLKWKDLVTPGTTLPTPWPKDEFEKFQRDVQSRRRQIRAANRPEAEMDALFREEGKTEDQMLGTAANASRVGAFEGANYEARGYYRPQINCLMFTRGGAFCSVCRRAIERVIAMYSQ
jgi:hypothetical protein